MIEFGQSLQNLGRFLIGKGMIIGKSRKELDKMRAVGELIAEVREEIRRMVQPGISTLELDQSAEKMMREAGAIPAFKGYMGTYPGSICASVNHVVVHGIPSSDVVLNEGDIFSVDMAAILDGFVGDTATTIPVGKVDAEKAQLINVTEECLRLAVEQCRIGRHVGDIGFAVESHAKKFGYGIVKGFTGHGIGRKMHEDPQIPNYGKPGTKEKIRLGYVFAIEPMINVGTEDTEILADGWTVVTKDGKPSAHCEHTVAVTENGPEILTFTKEQKRHFLQTCNVVEAALTV
ncbi:MAG: type I methionyl aminopeptidase [Pyrinomonadaceae bacterium]